MQKKNKPPPTPQKNQNKQKKKPSISYDPKDIGLDVSNVQRVVWLFDLAGQYAQISLG